jgi:hypothetical protein
MNLQQTIICLLIHSTTFLCGQTFDANYFKKTSWFSDNKDSAFYKSDTVRFIQYSNFGPAEFSKEHAEYEMKYLGHGDFVKFSFLKQRKMQLSERLNNSIGIVKSGMWSWTFENNTLHMYNERKLICSFRPISEKIIKIESRFAKQEELLTTKEIVLVRVK